MAIDNLWVDYVRLLLFRTAAITFFPTSKCDLYLNCRKKLIGFSKPQRYYMKQCYDARNKMVCDLCQRILFVFRWFKFTLQPPYSIMHGELVIGHLGHFLLDFLAQIWTQRTLRHILGPILVIFEICQFLTIPGHV